jgi:hypothetical protein
MRRIGRRVFNVAALLSLVLCLATVSLWVRSYWVQDYAARIGLRQYVTASCRGQLIFERLTALQIDGGDPVPIASPPRFLHQSAPPELSIIKRGFYAYKIFEEEYGDGYRRVETQAVGFPCWVAAMAFAISPLVVARLHYRESRRKALVGCCRKCGYNLTGNVSGVCPECGMPITPKA